jgi:hypothetical protein
MHSQTRLRSGCAPEHQGCAQIALQNTRTALRLHSQTPGLRSDCTPKHQNCAEIALTNAGTAFRLHSKWPRLQIPKFETALRASLGAHSERHSMPSQTNLSDCNPNSGCFAGRFERTPSVGLQDSASSSAQQHAAPRTAPCYQRSARAPSLPLSPLPHHQTQLFRQAQTPVLKHAHYTQMSNHWDI